MVDEVLLGKYICIYMSIYTKCLHCFSCVSEDRSSVNSEKINKDSNCIRTKHLLYNMPRESSDKWHHTVGQEWHICSENGLFNKL